MSLPPAAPSIHPLSHWDTSTDKFQPIGVSQLNGHANLRLFLSYWSWATRVHGHSWCCERCDVSDWIQIGFSGRFLGLASELWFHAATVLGTGNCFKRKSEYFIEIYVENVCICVCVWMCACANALHLQRRTSLHCATRWVCLCAISPPLRQNPSWWKQPGVHLLFKHFLHQNASPVSILNSTR